ncbi:MAG: SDR family oxidoreductase [Pseudomonadales bacterium]|nr:SDR family oxidoreductase [Pseudomonadales bacterium]
MADRFEGKGVIITGGASGIGAATAARFVAEGASVVVSDIDPAGETYARSLGENTTFIQCDVADSGSVEALIARGVEWLAGRGRHLDVLFNNAGIGSFGEAPDMTDEAWHRVVDIDLHGVFYGCRAAITEMRSRGGVIVNTASISGLFGDYGFAAYNAAKAAVINLTRTLSMDHGKDNIRVNALCPGVIRTGLTAGLEQAGPLIDEWLSTIPLGRIGEADEMAGVVLFLCSDDASYITGAAIVADGGMTARTGQPNFTRWLTPRDSSAAK